MHPINTRLDRVATNLEAVAGYSKKNQFNSTKAQRTVQVALRILESEFLGRQWDSNRDKKIIERMQQAVIKIKQKQASFSNNLAFLEEEINQLLREGTIKRVFQAEAFSSSLPRKLQAPFRYIFNLLTKRISNSIRAHIYYGWSKKIKDEKIKNLVKQDYKARYDKWYKAAKSKAQTKQQQQHAQQIFDAELAALNQQVANDPKVKAIAGLEKKAEKTRKLFMDIGGERVQLKTADGVNLDATYLSANEFKQALLAQGAQKVSYTFPPQGFQISGISITPDVAGQSLIKKLAKLGLLATPNQPGAGYGLLYDHNVKRYVIMSKEELQKLSLKGCIRFDANTPLNVNASIPAYELFQGHLVAYTPLMVAEDFRQNILNTHGRLQEIVIKGKKESIPAFSYSNKINSTPPGFIALQIPDQMGGTYYMPKDKADELVREGVLIINIHGHYTWTNPQQLNSIPSGFVALKIPDHKKGGNRGGTYYMPKDKADELVREGVLTNTNGHYSWANPQNVSSTSPKNPYEWTLQQEGVAILSSGNAGVYEMHKGEALALLMNGCDVMMLNLRGYGGSEGEPTAEGNYQDLEAAYQFVKHHRPELSDSKIAAWALCLSGGMAAHLAEKHPHINLFLNQTYAEFWDIIHTEIEKNLDNYLKKHIQSSSDRSLVRSAIKGCLLPIISQAVKLFAPNYNVKDRLSKIKGKICVIQATDDTLMTAEETEKMRKAIKGKQVDCKFEEIPGGHCTPWNQVAIYWTPPPDNREVMPIEYTWITLGGNSIFLSLKDLGSQQGISRIDSNTGAIYQFSLQDPDDINSDVNVTITYPHLLLLNPVNMQIPKFRVTEKEMPKFVSDLQLTPEFRGHHHIKDFLQRAQLGYSLI